MNPVTGLAFSAGHGRDPVAPGGDPARRCIPPPAPRFADRAFAPHNSVADPGRNMAIQSGLPSPAAGRRFLHPRRESCA